MPTPTLATKLFVPPPPQKVVVRPRLIERLNEGLHRRLTLISASAGSGKSTLVSEWIAGCERPAAWLSLDEGDSDPRRFLTYLVAALRTIAPEIGGGVVRMLQSPQPASGEAILTALLNEITAIPEDFVLVLDDYHLIDARPVDDALAFLLEHLPPRMHLVIATREDPRLPLARLRARSQLTELRAADLRFTPAEAAAFLNGVMDLDLSDEDAAALETRTEGWITGLQLAAISMQGQKDASGFIRSFTGSHYFVLDYLVEEVLHQQSASVQAFLLRTSILDRLCGPLCDAVLKDNDAPGQETLEYLERANLFLVPLDDERRWYRYHHLFADLLRQRLQQSTDLQGGEQGTGLAGLHIRASQWFEAAGLEIEAFEHAAAAGDVDRASRLLQGKGMPLHVRGALVPVLNWLESLPEKALDDKPVLWVMYAGALTIAGLTAGVEQKLKAAEDALQGAGPDDAEARDLLGRIASNRATLAVSQYQTEAVILQANRALEYLRTENLPVRNIVMWALGVAYLMKRDLAAARRAFDEAIAMSEAIGHTFVTELATIGIGGVLEAENRLHEAAETYGRALKLFGDQPLPIACEAHLGLARIHYELNDLKAAGHHGQESLKLARQFAGIIDRYVICEVFLARLLLAKGDTTGAAEILAGADQAVRHNDFTLRTPEVAAARVLTLLHQGDVEAAASLAQSHDLPLSQARVSLAQDDTSAALAILEPLRRQLDSEDWKDEQLKVMILRGIALYANGETDEALQLIGDALKMAEPEGFIRTFIDEGPPMARLLSDASARGFMPGYAAKLLAEFETVGQQSQDRTDLPLYSQSHPVSPAAQPTQPLDEPLSRRELEVLELIARGRSNREISEQLYLALSTVKGHNRMIFSKLQVQRRTEAVARARELGLL